jgi:hypothetical protein
MTEQAFVYWLAGFLELADPKTLDAKQVQIIKDHLALVLTKVTPDRSASEEDKEDEDDDESERERRLREAFRIIQTPGLICSPTDPRRVTYC